MEQRPATKGPTVLSADLVELFRLAIDHHKRGQFLEAISLYDRIIALNPDFVGAHNNRAAALHKLGRYDEALASCYRVVALEPGNAEAQNKCGFLLSALGRHAEALVCYERAIALKPDYPVAHNNRGSAMYKLGRFDEALASCNLAIALRADYAEAYCGRGNVLYDFNRFDEALASYDRAIALKSDYTEAYNNRGNALDKLGRHNDALASYDCAIALNPDHVSAHYNRGNALYSLRRCDEALASHERAIALEPQHARAQLNKGVLQLLLGNYEEGFETYEWRWRAVPTLKPREFTQPQWRGEPIAEKTILLHIEQGFGDNIQMLRYLPLVRARAAHVILELPKTIRPLFGPMTDGVEVIEPGSLPPPFDVHCPMMSLPLTFGTRVDSVPAQTPYLTVPDERVPIWRRRLPKSATPRVGLAWSGSSTNTNDRNRNIALDRLAPLLTTKGFSFVSLQREYRDSDLPALARLPIERIDDAIRDFGDTAAAIDQCDLVISVDTAVAHLAGSLGKPLWLLLTYAADWRWLLDRTDSPWYPTARLFRQTKIGDWEGVIATAIDELSTFSKGLANAEKTAMADALTKTGPLSDPAH